MMMNTRHLKTLLYCIATFLSTSVFANEWKNPDAQEEVKPTASPGKTKNQTLAPRPPLKGMLSVEVMRICSYEKSYTDKGSGGKIDGSFFKPLTPPGYFLLGHYAQGNYHAPSDCILAVKPANQESAGLLEPPSQWKRIWRDKGSGANNDGSIWRAIPENESYTCLGDISTKGYKQPPVTNYACIHNCLVEKLPAGQPVWSTKGTGAKEKAYMYKLHNSNSFITLSDKRQPDSVIDIKPVTECQF